VHNSTVAVLVLYYTYRAPLMSFDQGLIFGRMIPDFIYSSSILDVAGLHGGSRRRLSQEDSSPRLRRKRPGGLFDVGEEREEITDELGKLTQAVIHGRSGLAQDLGACRKKTPRRAWFP
jgi:hypothetical protein